MKLPDLGSVEEVTKFFEDRPLENWPGVGRQSGKGAVVEGRTILACPLCSVTLLWVSTNPKGSEEYAERHIQYHIALAAALANAADTSSTIASLMKGPT